MPSITAREQLKQDERLVRITSSQLSKPMRCSVPSRVMPALLTRMSIGPSSASMRATPPVTAAKSPTSNL